MGSAVRTNGTTGSSLIRHLRKKCNQPQLQTVRRKACTQCVTDKTRCSLKRPSCSRCSLRQIPCEYPYPTPDSSTTSTSPPSESEEADPNLPVQGQGSVLQLEPEVVVSQTAILPEPPAPVASANFFDTLFPSDSCAWDLSLSSEINSFLVPRRDSLALVLNDSDHIFTSGILGDISTALVPAPKRTLDSALLHHSMEFIFRVLRSWPRMLAEEFQTPPLIHHTQIADSKRLPKPLANCFTLVKMWHGRCQGSDEMVHRLIENEVNTLLTKVRWPRIPTHVARRADKVIVQRPRRTRPPRRPASRRNLHHNPPLPQRRLTPHNPRSKPLPQDPRPRPPRLEHRPLPARRARTDATNMVNMGSRHF
jgi:hypothetical protein